jgi:hypothetical protein
MQSKTKNKNNMKNTTTLDENSEMILVTILIQQYQPMSVFDIINKAKDNGFDIDDEENIQEIVENLKRRDLISVIYVTRNNQKITAYGMSKPIFKKIPETAMLKDILPSFEKSKEAKDFLKLLDNQTSNTTKGKDLGYRDYKSIEIVIENMSPIVGGSLNKPKKLTPEVENKFKEIEQENKGKKKSKNDDLEEKEKVEKAYLIRDYEGNIVFTPNQVRQYFIKLLRPKGLADSASEHIRFKNATVEPNGLSVEQWPLIINGVGRGVKTAESLLPGAKIHFNFLFPFTGTKIKNQTELENAFKTLCEYTGFGCYSKKFGRCKFVSIKVRDI